MGEFIYAGFVKDCIRVWHKWMILMDEAYNWERLPAVALPICKVGDIAGISNVLNGRTE